jgi:hypothetical protein
MEKTQFSFIDKAILGLKKTAAELEEFQLQLALGKADASDKFEELKKGFNTIVQDAKTKFSKKDLDTDDLKKKFEEIQHLLAPAKVETRAAFIEQKETILNAIEEIEQALRTSSEVDKEYHFVFNTEVEKFKIKVEILRLQFEYGKLVSKKEFESMKEDFVKKIDKLKVNFKETESSFEKYWDNFRHEMSDAYTHLKKAFV